MPGTPGSTGGFAVVRNVASVCGLKLTPNTVLYARMTARTYA
jgi:hypothetical protein